MWMWKMGKSQLKIGSPNRENGHNSIMAQSKEKKNPWKFELLDHVFSRNETNAIYIHNTFICECREKKTNRDKIKNPKINCEFSKEWTFWTTRIRENSLDDKSIVKSRKGHCIGRTKNSNSIIIKPKRMQNQMFDIM